eukprot:CAMPEP_0202974644 /NCGR_PEP_ID=MMETSP1396-20130829/62261_1 /ASSEMBLY_ACC=CAM_ASM_000872 /TAXON_ID= /ORGANISM="Pseudokeronopsis sp., Strain Brazil" /LENGTH=84 /DNA_ID=CAMNT_0049708807 /DNA_START=115 /DNA_END=365 /DNA_ORIENTATION=+
MTLSGEGLSHHTYKDIGRYTVFPDKMFCRMFPEGKCFGRYEVDEYQWNKTYGIMCREEGLRITNELSRLTLPHERQVNFTKLMS